MTLSLTHRKMSWWLSSSLHIIPMPLGPALHFISSPGSCQGPFMLPWGYLATGNSPKCPCGLSLFFLNFACAKPTTCNECTFLTSFSSPSQFLLLSKTQLQGKLFWDTFFLRSIPISARFLPSALYRGHISIIEFLTLHYVEGVCACARSAGLPGKTRAH